MLVMKNYSEAVFLIWKRRLSAKPGYQPSSFALPWTETFMGESSKDHGREI